MTSDTIRLTVRSWDERDLEPLARSLRLSQHHIQGRWLERLAGLQTSAVAELEGETVGSVSFEKRAEFPALLHLYALAVVEWQRRRGIGTLLVAQVEEEARGSVLEGVHLAVAIENVGALRLYGRLGYRRVGEPYTARWTWYGPDGEEREVVERCYRMVKRFGPIGGLARAKQRAGRPARHHHPQGTRRYREP